MSFPLLWHRLHKAWSSNSYGVNEVNFPDVRSVRLFKVKPESYKRAALYMYKGILRLVSPVRREKAASFPCLPFPFFLPPDDETAVRSRISLIHPIIFYSRNHGIYISWWYKRPREGRRDYEKTLRDTTNLSSWCYPWRCRARNASAVQHKYVVQAWRQTDEIHKVDC